MSEIFLKNITELFLLQSLIMVLKTQKHKHVLICTNYILVTNKF